MSVRRMVLGAVVVCLVVTGCSSVPPPAPSAAPVRDPATLSSPEVTELAAECIGGKGWEIVVGRTSIFPNVPPEQIDAFQKDLLDCHSELGFDQVKPPKYTPEYLAKKYEQEKETWECLVEQGVDVPELPSVQTYTDLFFNEGTVFSSYDNLPPVQSAADELRAICGDPIESWTSDFYR